LNDGHQARNPRTRNSSKRAFNITPPSKNFIINTKTPYEWTQKMTQDNADVDGSGTLRSAFWSKADGTGVCPAGFRVP
jgi:hypothetical protein